MLFCHFYYIASARARVPPLLRGQQHGVHVGVDARNAAQLVVGEQRPKACACAATRSRHGHRRGRLIMRRGRSPPRLATGAAATLMSRPLVPPNPGFQTVTLPSYPVYAL